MGEPDVAHDPPEDPVTQAFVDRGEGKDGGGEEEVAKGQVPDEVVRDGTQRSVPEESQSDQEVAERGRCADGQQDGHDADHAGQVVVDRQAAFRVGGRLVRISVQFRNAVGEQ